jgi:hypothetical protein
MAELTTEFCMYARRPTFLLEPLQMHIIMGVVSPCPIFFLNNTLPH